MSLVRLDDHNQVVVEIRDSSESHSNEEVLTHKQPDADQTSPPQMPPVPTEPASKGEDTNIVIKQSPSKKRKRKESDKEDGEVGEASQQPKRRAKAKSSKGAEEAEEIVDDPSIVELRQFLTDLKVEGKNHHLFVTTLTVTFVDSTFHFFTRLSCMTVMGSDYFLAVDDVLKSQNFKDLPFSAPNLNLIPKQFLLSWYDPFLAGVNKEETLTWVASALESVRPSLSKLRVGKLATEG